MRKYSYFTIAILFHGLISGSEDPAGRERERSDAERASAETFGSVILSSNLPRLPDDFCEEVISCAPEIIKKRVKLIDHLRTLKTVASQGNLLSPEDLLKESLSHYMIFHGLPGGGKTTLARVIAQRLGKPFMIIKAPQLGNEFGHSVESGIRRIGAVAAKAKATVIIDEADCIWKPKKENLKNETANVEAQALWVFLDEMQAKDCFFMATSNDLTNMPEPLLSRFEGCLYQIPTIHLRKTRERAIRSFLNARQSTELEHYINDLTGETSGLSHRQMRKIVLLAQQEALFRDISNPDIQFDDFVRAIAKLKQDRKTGQKKEWTKEEIFQLIAVSASAFSIISAFWSFYSGQQSLKYAAQGITYQGQGIALQSQGVALQGKSLELQEEGISLQRTGISLQSEGLDCQKKGLSLQKWQNPPAALASATWSGVCWAGTKSCDAVVWSAKKSLEGAKLVGRNTVPVAAEYTKQSLNLARLIAQQTHSATMWSARKILNGLSWMLGKKEQK